MGKNRKSIYKTRKENPTRKPKGCNYCTRGQCPRCTGRGCYTCNQTGLCACVRGAVDNG